MKTLRTILAGLHAIVALNALGGGFYGMTGAKGVPIEWLEGSPFENYFLPGLFLFIGIGCYNLIVSFLLMKRERSIWPSFTASLILITWIAAQMAIIGFVSWLQPTMAVTALVMISLALVLKRHSLPS